jgi:hypothetical protein
MDGTLELSPDDLAAFDRAWDSRWQDLQPIGHQLRSSAPATWLRLHSLPDSKRYASNDSEYEELLSRHLTVLAELSAACGNPAGGIRLITASWSDSPEPEDRRPVLPATLPLRTDWRSVPHDLTEPAFPVWAHLHVNAVSLDDQVLVELLRLVADDAVADVIICPPDARWLYHPYDGGADVIAPDAPTRDLLRSRHADWLSALPSGL